jgi:hypothetical protein
MMEGERFETIECGSTDFSLHMAPHSESMRSRRSLLDVSLRDVGRKVLGAARRVVRAGRVPEMTPPGCQAMTSRSGPHLYWLGAAR